MTRQYPDQSTPFTYTHAKRPPRGRLRSSREIGKLGTGSQVTGNGVYQDLPLFLGRNIAGSGKRDSGRVSEIQLVHCDFVGIEDEDSRRIGVAGL